MSHYPPSPRADSQRRICRTLGIALKGLSAGRAAQFVGVRPVRVSDQLMSQKGKRRHKPAVEDNPEEVTAPRAEGDERTRHPLLSWAHQIATWILVGIIVPLVVGLALLVAELRSEKPAIRISNTRMPELDALVLYSALLQSKMSYSEDDWCIHAHGLPPFDDPNPIFRVSDLPAIDIPITLVNVGRRPTTVNAFSLIVYGSPSLVSNPGIIIGGTGDPQETQSVYVDIGQEQEIIARFTMLEVQQDLIEPPYRSVQWAHQVTFKGLMQLTVADVEGRSSSALIDFGQAQVNGDQLLFWWATHVEGQETFPVTGTSVAASEVSLSDNPYVIGAYVKAGAAYLGHECSDCAIGYLTHALVADPANAEAYYYRGLVYKGMGDVQKARVDFARCAQLSQEFACTEELEQLRTSE